MTYRMFYAADPRTDDRRRTRHRFHRCNAERFVPRRGYENVGRTVVVTQHVATTPTDEPHAIGYASFRGDPLQPTDFRRCDRTRPVGFAADNNEQGVEF